MEKMHVILFEDQHWSAFLPLVYTRPVGLLRIGMHTMAERWSLRISASVSHSTRPHLQALFPVSEEENGMLINARLLPDTNLVAAIMDLRPGEALKKDNDLLAVCFDKSIGHQRGNPKTQIEYDKNCVLIEAVTDLFTKNDAVIRNDFEWFASGKTSEPLNDSNRITGPADRLFIEPGAAVNCSIFNTNDGPIYIGSGAEVMEGCMIRGPFSLGDNSQVKMGTKVYGATSIGPHCRVGGEISNSVLMGFSNKGHDGFLGNSILGEWCNLGADTNTSNLKNNYSSVRIWNYDQQREMNSGLTFCGLIMGDHSKSGINTMFNTGTMVGVCANIFGSGFPPKHIPSFAWGGSDLLQEHDLSRALDTAERVMSRRLTLITVPYREMLTEVFEMTAGERRFATQSQE